MTPYSLLLSAMAAVLVLACDGANDAPAPGRSASPPADPSEATALDSAATNLVIITIDTARADAFGVYGQKLPTSPNIDRMAQEGVLFEHATSASPSTLPSHTTIMTGKLPFAHGVRANGGYVVGREQTTLAEVLRARGYVTGAEIAAPVIGKQTELDQGFAHYRDPRDYDIERKQIAVAGPDGFVRKQEGHDRDAADITKRGLEFLSRNRDRPFFLWLHYFDPHAFYQAPPEFAARFKDSPYHAEIHYADYQVGRILSSLRSLGLRDRTLVVLTSDHGEGLGEHDEETHSFFVYETTLRVPLVLWGATGLPQGVRVGHPVRTADIAPTVLDFMEQPPLSDIQGVSLLSLARNPNAPERTLPGYGESAEPLALFGSSMLRSIRLDSWKYIHKLSPELYDVANDPGETKNIAAQEPSRVAQMQQALVELVETETRATASRVSLGASEVSELQALGYIGAVTPEDFSDEIDVRATKGPDPAAMAGELRSYARGIGAMRSEDFDIAIDEMSGLHERHPESAAIRDGLIEALDAAKRWERVIPIAREALAVAPDNLLAFTALGHALMGSGRLEEAELHLRSGAASYPCDAQIASTLSVFLHRLGREADRFAVLEDALVRCPNAAYVKNDLAYALATSGDRQRRDGARALRLAQAAVASANGERPDFVDTLACAQAQAGDFRGAIENVERALRQLRKREYPPEVIAEVEQHRELFVARRRVGDRL